MSVSIIIPAYNAAKYLPQTVQSVLDQNVQDFDLVIVDDGSTDATGRLADELAKRDSRIRAIHQKNRGLSAARNAGLAASDPSRPFVYFLDADDLVEPDALAALSEALRRETDCPAAHGTWRYIDSDGQPIEKHQPERWLMLQGRKAVQASPESRTDRRMFVIECCIAVGGLLIRRQALLAAGGFDETLRAGEDLDCWYRLADKTGFVFVPMTMMAYRRHPGSMSINRNRRMREYHFRARAKWLKHATPRDSQLIWAGHRAFCRYVAAQQLRQNAQQLLCVQWSRFAKGLRLTAWCCFKALPFIPDLALAVGMRKYRIR